MRASASRRSSLRRRFPKRSLIPGRTCRAPLSRVCAIENGYDGPRTFAPTGSVTDFREEKESISLDVSTESPQLLVVTTTWYPGWHAFVDGKAVPIYRSNGSFMAVAIPAGRHSVFLRFWPAPLVALLVLNIVAFRSYPVLACCG